MTAPTVPQQVPPPAALKTRLGLRLTLLGLGAGLLASTCCVLPLALVLAGITGAWMANLAVLKPLTPLLIVLTLALLGWAGWLVFRPASECAVGERAACARDRRTARVVYVLCVLFVGPLLLFPLFASYFY
jgi:mercuric ion transport protein